jgi:hypothetical protein
MRAERFASTAIWVSSPESAIRIKVAGHQIETTDSRFSVVISRAHILRGRSTSDCPFYNSGAPINKKFTP